jgi:GntR family transcriptional regulator
MRMLGKEPTSRILSFDIAQPSEKAAGELHLEANQKVYLLERLRSADGQPISIERVYLPFHRFPTFQSDTGGVFI